MSINLDSEDVDDDFWGDLIDNRPRPSKNEAPQTPIKPELSTVLVEDILDGVKGVGGVIPCFKEVEINNSKGEEVENGLNTPYTPNTRYIAEESAFFQIIGHLPGDAWEGELPDGGVFLARSIPWPEVMQGAAEDRQFGRKTTLALMLPHHEGKFEWYEHPITKKWHSYAAFPK